MRIGAWYKGNGFSEFTVWAPFCGELKLKIVHPEPRVIPMHALEKGYWQISLEETFPGTLYFYALDSGKARPDPASFFQPHGIHGPSQVIDHNSFHWQDHSWKGTDLSRMIIYELHVGTFTPEGSFDAIIPRLDDLLDLGVNTLEIMPVAQFPGERNWGYDGAYPYAVQNSYGGPEGLKRLINECHKKGFAVKLDVVYNHFGPEGTYIQEFGPYFTDKYKTFWGDAMNFDGAYSDEVRNYFIRNAEYWFSEYHIDALRLDAVQGICDMSAVPFLQQIGEAARRFSESNGRKFYMVAESDLNDSRIIRPREQGGFDFDAQWSDDFHHALHTLLTKDRQGYYVDFGKAWQFGKALKEAFVYTGQYAVWRKRSHGNSVKDRPAREFVIFVQNHDQVGNRMHGDRLSTLVPFEAQKLAAGALLLAPYVPLLFMGEEYGEDAPFLYFISPYDINLGGIVRREREKGFEANAWEGIPPDPNDPQTFQISKLNWDRRKEGRHAVLLRFYKKLLELRRTVPVLVDLDNDRLETWSFEANKVVIMRRWNEANQVLVFMNLGSSDSLVSAPAAGEWRKIIDSANRLWGGPGESAPDALEAGQEFHLKGFSLALFGR